MKDEYSSYKIVHHYDKIQQLRDGDQTVPLQVQMVPSNRCNQRCTFCAYRMKDYLSNEQFDEKDMLQYEKVIETINCSFHMGVKAIQYTGGGEPLVHPRITDIFKYTIDKGIDLAVVSNGMALKDEQFEILGNASWVRISVDCSNAETYGFLRNVKKETFDLVISNIKKLVKHRRRCVLGVGFVVERENYEQIFDSAKLFKDLGVNNFRISAAFTPIGYSYFNDFGSRARELAQKTQELSDDNFTVFNLFGDRVIDSFEGKQDYDYCPIKDLMTYVGGDYNVYTCCTLAYNKKGFIGSIKDQSLQDLWSSEEKKNMFKMHSPRKDCRHSCMYRSKNEFINYCIKKNPKHINFI